VLVVVEPQPHRAVRPMRGIQLQILRNIARHFVADRRALRERKVLLEPVDQNALLVRTRVVPRSAGGVTSTHLIEIVCGVRFQPATVRVSGPQEDDRRAQMEAQSGDRAGAENAN
jgi:hypothetical protein